MSTVEAAKEFTKKALAVLQAFNVTYNPKEQTFTVGASEPAEYITTGIPSDDLTDMFVTMGRTAAKAGRVICFFIDEIQYMKDNEKPANDFGVKYTEDALKEILRWSKGYPYFIQELCSVIWEYTEGDTISETDVEHVIPIFLKNLDESLFKVRYERCTKKEHDFLFAMVKCGTLPCTISNVAHFMKKRGHSISPLSAQLIQDLKLIKSSNEYRLLYEFGRCKYTMVEYVVASVDDMELLMLSRKVLQR